MDDLYRDAAPSVNVSIPQDIISGALNDIYHKNVDPNKDIDPALFNAFWQKFNDAAAKGVSESKAPTPQDDFLDALKYNNAVFSAFKVHRLQHDVAAQLTDSNGNLKPFEQWLKDVQPIASHHCANWFQTEYSTAVIRAHQAADWQQFEREKDVLPNLKWMPSTSVHPGEDHQIFWGTILPIDDPFWDEHRPGDRWNCKCSLTSTDKPCTDIPGGSRPNDNPQPGLDNNPGKDAKLFSDSHPYIADASSVAKEATTKLQQRIESYMKEMPKNLTQEEKIAKVQNYLEMEKALNTQKGKPMSIEDADRQKANPNYVPRFIFDPKGKYINEHGDRVSRNPNYKLSDKPNSINCQTCAPAYILRTCGFDVTAKPREHGSQLEYLAKGHAFEVWNNIDGTPATHIGNNDWMKAKDYKQMSEKRYMEFFNENCKDVGVYELCIEWKSGGGHATILQRLENGNLKYIEPQADNQTGSGYEWKDVNYLCKHGAVRVHDCMGVMRVDNKLFNTDFIGIFNVRRKK